MSETQMNGKKRKESQDPKEYCPPRLRLHGELEALTRGGPNPPPEDIFGGSGPGT